MLAQRSGIEIAGENLAFVVAKRQQSHERVLNGLPHIEIDICHLLFDLNGQMPRPFRVEWRLHQDVFFLCERHHQIGVVFQSILQPAHDVGFHIHPLPVTPTRRRDRKRHLTVVLVACFIVQIPGARITEPRT